LPEALPGLHPGQTKLDDWRQFAQRNNSAFPRWRLPAILDVCHRKMASGTTSPMAAPGSVVAHSITGSGADFLLVSSCTGGAAHPGEPEAAVLREPFDAVQQHLARTGRLQMGKTSAAQNAPLAGSRSTKPDRAPIL